MRNGGFIGDLNIPKTRATKGIYTVNEAQEFMTRRIWPVFPGDASFSSVVWLCHCRTQLDDTALLPNEATGGDIIVPNGSANGQKFVTTQTKWYGTSFNLNNSYLRVGNNPGIQFGTGDFTIEAWIYPTSVNSGGNVFDNRNSEPNVAPLWFLDTTAKLHLYVNGVDNKILTASNVMTNGSWHFLALSRVSGNTRMYVNGTQVGSTYVDANNYIKGGGAFGASFNGASAMVNAFLGDTRVTVGVGRYSGTTHTVPTGPFQDTA